jgi:hypothetical protein
MAKTKVSQWDSVAANNTDINSININEGCPPSTINNAIRELMKEIKDWQDGSSGDGWTSSGTITSSGTFAVTGNFTVDGASGTSGQYLTSAGSGSTPTWETLSIPNDAITTVKILNANVTTAKIADSNITTAKIADVNVTTAKIADSNVTTAKIADGNITSAKLATGVGGKVLQVLFAQKTDTQTLTKSLTFQDITGLSIAITPSSSSNKILVMYNVNMANGGDTGHGYLRLHRDTTNIGSAASAGSRTTAIAVVNTGNTGQMQCVSGTFLDSPSTTSATTYKLLGASNPAGASTTFINRSERDTDAANNDGRASSSITIMEIAG